MGTTPPALRPMDDNARLMTMPVFFHDNTERIEEYVRSEELDILLLPVEGGIAKKIQPHDIGVYLQETFNYLGSYPREYILAGSSSRFKSLDVQTVTDAIRTGESDSIVILGYNDGGVFSITGSLISFQIGERETVGWKCFDHD